MWVTDIFIKLIAKTARLRWEQIFRHLIQNVENVYSANLFKLKIVILFFC
jgi:hypothetical protein